MSFALTTLVAITLAVSSIVCLTFSGMVAVISTLMSPNVVVDVFGDCVLTTVFAAGRLRGCAGFGAAFFAVCFFGAAFLAAVFFAGFFLSVMGSNSSTTLVLQNALLTTFMR